MSDYNGAMITFEVEYKGKTETVGIDDELTFGEAEEAVRRNVNTSDILDGKVNVDISGYGVDIAVAAVKQAPWETGKRDVFMRLPLKVGRVVVGEASKQYPLADALMGWVSSFQAEQQ